MACVAYEPETVGSNILVAVTKLAHDPHDFELTIAMGDEGRSGIFQLCKRCGNVYSTALWVKAQDGTTGGALDERSYTPTLSFSQVSALLNAFHDSPLSQETAWRLLATVRAWYPRLVCDQLDCDEESWSPFHYCEKHQAEHRLKAEPVDKDPEKMGGSPCVVGTRVPVRSLLGLLSSGYALEVVREQFPQLSLQQIGAAIEWAAEAIEGFPDQPPPKPSVDQLGDFVEKHADLEPIVMAWLRYQAEAE